MARGWIRAAPRNWGLNPRLPHVCGASQNESGTQLPGRVKSKPKDQRY
jgi:hypothetical protein